jgi:hypothetical protein
VMKKLFFLLVFILLTASSMTGQNKIREALDTLEKFFPQEKIYILYNKAEYLAGETIWFSSMVFADYDLTSISTNIYVELFDHQKNLVARKQLPLLNGQAEGQFELSDKLPEGIYYVHAYTQWMLNFSDSFHYLHPVIVYNPKSAQKIQAQSLPWKAEAFPEGGNLVGSVFTRIGIRLHSLLPLPARWRGYVVEERRSEKIAEFTSLDQNVALTAFTPEAEHRYNIVVEDEDNQRQVIPLKPVLKEGVHFKVEQQNDTVFFTVYFKNVSGFTNYKLVGSINNSRVYQATIKKFGETAKSKIPLSGMDHGILRLALFDNNDSLLAERLCFVRPESLSIKTPVLVNMELSTDPRSLNSFSFLSDSVENPYTIVVMDPTAKTPSDEDNFLSALWLTNDITTPVQQPGQYFRNTKQSAEALDALLITEKWKRFDWTDVLKGRYPTLKYLPDNYLSYKGTVKRNKKPVVSEDINLLFRFPDSSLQVVQVCRWCRQKLTITAICICRISFFTTRSVFIIK